MKLTLPIVQNLGDVNFFTPVQLSSEVAVSNCLIGLAQLAPIKEQPQK